MKVLHEFPNKNNQTYSPCDKKPPINAGVKTSRTRDNHPVMKKRNHDSRLHTGPNKTNGFNGIAQKEE
jgi:hypothetical protein